MRSQSIVTMTFFWARQLGQINFTSGRKVRVVVVMKGKLWGPDLNPIWEHQDQLGIDLERENRNAY